MGWAVIRQESTLKFKRLKTKELFLTAIPCSLCVHWCFALFIILLTLGHEIIEKSLIGTFLVELQCKRNFRVFLFKKNIYVYVYVFLSVCTCTSFVQWPRKSEESVRPIGTGVTGACEPPNIG